MANWKNRVRVASTYPAALIMRSHSVPYTFYLCSTGASLSSRLLAVAAYASQAINASSKVGSAKLTRSEQSRRRTKLYRVSNSTSSSTASIIVEVTTRPSFPLFEQQLESISFSLPGLLHSTFASRFTRSFLHRCISPPPFDPCADTCSAARRMQRQGFFHR
jgi:hypothetical protein